jgi:hypothetical protein
MAEPRRLPTPTADIERGRWILDELGAWATVDGFLPPRFIARARIFHPAEAQDLLWDDGWVSSAGTNRMRWAEVADRQNTVFHPLAQWESVLGDYHQPPYGTNGWQCEPPRLGQLDLDQLAAIATVLARHTTTPEDCLATLWDGHGDLYPDSIRYLTLSGVEPDETADDPGEDDPAAVVASELPPIGPLPFSDPSIAAAVAGPRFPLPGRDSLLFELDIRSLTYLDWAERSGWARVGDPSPLTPQTIWPGDRRWYLASEIDFDSTLIAGSRALIDDLLAVGETGAIEVLEISRDADLSWNGDTINGLLPGM